MKYIITILLKLILLVVATSISQLNYANETGFFTVSVGHAGVFDRDLDDPEVVKLEYRFKPTKFLQLAPGLGVSRAGNNANFVFGFVERDFYVKKHWVVSPNFGAGFFNDSESLNLGYDIQFRSGVRIAYEFENKMRLGVELFHLSNGGLGDSNPGTEPAFLSLSVPFGN
ncbi:acyloxyacyl hydrolase [Alteromonas sp. 5E99-2]|nr:acyloxyacyl hydrolase [Alteromonas sp. 5E99-2]